MKRPILIILLAILFALAACEKPAAPKTGITLRCAFIGYGDYEALYGKLPQFERETGIDVEITYLDNHFALDKKLKKDFQAGTVDYDVTSDHSSFFTQYVEHLEPLDDYFTDEELRDFLPRMLSCGKKDGALYVVPRHADISALLYRTDLFNDPDNQTLFAQRYGSKLQVPQTWDEFEQAATFFGSLDNLYGAQFAGKEEALTGRFYEILLSHGGKFIDENGLAAFNGPEGLKTANMLKALYQNGSLPEDTFDYLWDDVAKTFASGKSAMDVEWYSYYSWLQDPERSKVAGKFDIARLPKGDAGVHSGWIGMHGFSIMKRSPHKKEAAELIRFLTNYQNSYDEARIGYLPVRSSVWDRLIDEALTSKDPLQKKRLELAKLQFSQDSTTPPLIPEWISASDVLYPVLQNIMKGEISAKEGLDMAARQVNGLLAQP